MESLSLVAITYWMITMTLIHGQSYYHWTKGNDKKKDFIEYPGLWLRRQTIKSIKRTTPSECMNICKKTPNCRAVDFEHRKKECHLLPSVTSGTFVKYGHTTLFSAEENQCPSYCDELDYMNICGQCQCVSLCNSISPFYCDCSDVIPASPMCTKVTKDNDRNVSGIYKVSLDSSSINLMCQQTSEIPNGELWLTIFRKIGFDNNLKRHLKTYQVGFSEPYADKYFIGYNKVVELTKNGDVTLRVEMMSADGQEFSIEYDAFVFRVMTGQGGSFKGYALSYNKAITFTCVNDFYEETKENEKDTSCAYYHLLRNCDSEGNALGFGARSYQRITYMLSYGATLKIDEDDVITTQESSFMITNSDSLEYCIQFEFQITFSITSSGIRGTILKIDDILRLVLSEGRHRFVIGEETTQKKITLEEEKNSLHKWYKVVCSRYRTSNDQLKTVIYLDGTRIDEPHEEEYPVKFNEKIALIYPNPEYVKGNLRNVYINGIKYTV